MVPTTCKENGTSETLSEALGVLAAECLHIQRIEKNFLGFHSVDLSVGGNIEKKSPKVEKVSTKAAGPFDVHSACTRPVPFAAVLAFKFKCFGVAAAASRTMVNPSRSLSPVRVAYSPMTQRAY